MANLKFINYNGTTYDIEAVSADNAASASTAAQAGSLATEHSIDGIIFDGSGDIQHYAVCSTSGNTITKTISLNNFVLTDGARVAVKFVNANTQANPTLKVGTTAAKPIFYGTTAIESDAILAGQVFELIYDSTANSNNGAWLVVGGISESEGITYSEATTTESGLMSAADKNKLDQIRVSTIAGDSPIKVTTPVGSTEVTVSHEATSVDRSGSTYGDTTAQTPAFGGTFSVPSIGVDKYGHVTNLGEHTVKIPATEAGESNSGLMTAASYNKLNASIDIGDFSLTLGGPGLSMAELKEALNLSSAMRFIGITTTTMSDGLTTAAVSINNKSVTPVAGDVVISNDTHYEYVWTGSSWERLGPDGSYALDNHVHDVANADTGINGFMSATDKGKLDNIESFANVNIIESISFNNNPLSPDVNKNVNISIPVMDGTVGRVGMVPAPATGDSEKFLKADGTWAIPHDTTYEAASTLQTGQLGLMSYEEATALANIVSSYVSTVSGSGVINVTPATGKGDVTVSHAASTASGTFGPSSDGSSLKFGDTFTVPQVTFNNTGHLSSAANYTITIPNNRVNIDTSADGLMAWEDKNKLDLIEVDDIGTVKQINPGVGIIFTKGGSTATSITTEGAIKVALKSETPYNIASAAVPTPTTNTRLYPVGLANDAKLAVYVPWIEYDAASKLNAGELGLMSGAESTKLASMVAGAVPVSFSRTLNSGTAIGTITINGTDTTLYSTDWTAMLPASADAAGGAGYIGTAPGQGQHQYYWSGGGTWRGAPTRTGELGLVSYEQLTALQEVQSNRVSYLSATAPISVNNNVGEVTIAHDTTLTSAQAKSYGDTAAKTPGFGQTFSVPSFTVNTFGHLTAVGEHNVTIPNAPVSETADGLMTFGEHNKLADIDPQANNVEVVAPNTTPISVSGNKDNTTKLTTYTVTHDTVRASDGTYNISSAAASVPTKLISYTDTPDAVYNINVPGFTVNTTGHVSSAAIGTVAIPTVTENHHGFMLSSDKTKLDTISANATETEIKATTPILATSGSGNNENGYTGLVTISHATSGPSQTASTSVGDTVAQTPRFGGTFKVTSETVDKYGHTTTLAEHTVTVPDTLAGTNDQYGNMLPGLMSVSDKVKLDAFNDAWSYATTDYVNSALSAIQEPMVFKGVVNSYSDLPTSGYSSGWTYRVGTSGTYGDYELVAGDWIIRGDDGWLGISVDAGTLYKSGEFVNEHMLLAKGTQGQVKSIPVNPTIELNPGTDSTAPGIKFSIGGGTIGNTANEYKKFSSNNDTFVALNKATTSAFGVTKLFSGSNATDETVAVTPKGVWTAINTLDVTNVDGSPNAITGLNANRTLATLTETDGIINATFQYISIDTTQVSSGILPIERGGTGISGFTDNRLIQAVSANNAQNLASASGLYSDNTHLYVNYDDINDDATVQDAPIFKVNGESYLNGTTTIQDGILGLGAESDNTFSIITSDDLYLNSAGDGTINALGSELVLSNSGDVSLLGHNDVYITSDQNTELVSTNGNISLISDHWSNDPSSLGNITFRTNGADQLKHVVHSVDSYYNYYIPSINNTTTDANYPLVSTTTAGLNQYNSSVVMNGAQITVGQEGSNGSFTMHGTIAADGDISTASNLAVTGNATVTGTVNSTGGFVGSLTGVASQATAANISTILNSIAYYSDAKGTFASKPSADGALYATAANGSLQWGTLPVAQGGTGAKTAAVARINLGLGDAKVYYGTCSSGAAAPTKVVACENYAAQKEGDIVFVKFSNTNTAAVASLQMNVNGKGAHSIKTIFNNEIRDLNSVGQLQANGTYMFVFSNGAWIANLNYDSTINYQLRMAGSYVKAASAITANHIIVGTDSGYVMAEAGVRFDIRYPILYCNADVTANAVTSEAFYNINGKTIVSQSLNGTVSGTFAANKPLYLAGTLEDNIFTIDLDYPLTTTIPTSKDNKIYIDVGTTHSTSAFDFACSNKAFAFIGNAFVPTAAGMGGEEEVVTAEIIKLIPEDSAQIESNENKVFRWNGNSVTIWSDNVTPKSFQFVSAPTSSFEFHGDTYAVTSARAEMLGSAMMTDGGQGTGYFTLVALGDVPTEDCFIRVVYKYTSEDTLEQVESAASYAQEAAAAANRAAGSARMQRATISISGTDADGTNFEYPYKVEVRWPGVTSYDWVDGSGISDQDWAVESASDKVILHFSKDITTATSVNIYWAPCEEYTPTYVSGNSEIISGAGETTGGGVQSVNGFTPNGSGEVTTEMVVTQAQYDALTEAQKNSGITYYVKD